MALKDSEIREHLITAGIKNLKDYGYPNVNKNNIISELIYSSFFLAMLNDNLGKSTKKVDGVINELITEITDKNK